MPYSLSIITALTFSAYSIAIQWICQHLICVNKSKRLGNEFAVCVEYMVIKVNSRLSQLIGPKSHRMHC